MRKKDNQKVKAINDAVIDIVLNEGYQNLSMSKVAKAAGVSQATIYLTYASKAEMLTALYVKAHETLASQTKVDVHAGMDVEAAVRALFTSYMKTLLKHPKQGLYMNALNNTPSLIDQNVYQELMSRNQDIKALFDYGQSQGVIVKCDFDYLVAFTFDALNQLLALSYNRGESMTEAQIQTAVDMCWRVMKA